MKDQLMKDVNVQHVSITQDHILDIYLRQKKC